MSRGALRSVVLACLILSLGAVARAGDPPTELALLDLEGPFGSVGERVGVSPDLNGDGVRELLSSGSAGVLTYDGATGVKLSSHAVGASSLLNVDGSGEFDGDGVPDILVADGSSVRAYSRADGSLLWTFSGSPGGSIGWDLAVLGDIDGDGRDDVAAGEPDADPAGMNSAGSIHVLSGADGSLIHQIHGSKPQDKLGRSMAAFGDKNGDGKNDLIVGNAAFETGGQMVGRVRVISAIDGAVLQTVVNGSPNTAFAVEVADLGDVDGDGVRDLGVGSVISFTVVQAYSGASGALLWTAQGAPSFKVISIGDTDGDGAAEVACGSPGYLAFPGSGAIVDGATGAIKNSIPGGTPCFFLSAAAPGDLNGDGVPDVFIGAAATSGFNGGAYALHASPWVLIHSISNPPGGSLLGRAVERAGDHDGDGLADVVLVGALGLEIFSSADGSHLLSVSSAGALGSIFDSGLQAVAAVGDVDADGVPDYVAGNPYYSVSGIQFHGRAHLLSGATGAALATLVGAASNNLGAALEPVPDQNGDGKTDLWMGVPGMTAGANTKAGELRLLSGADLSLLATLPGAGQINGEFGVSISADQDLDGDGVPELLVGTGEDSLGSFNAGRAVLFDGATLTQLAVFNGNLDSGLVKGQLVPDGNGDGVPDILTSEAGYLLPGENTKRGRVRLWSGASFGLLWQALGPDADGQLGAGFGSVGDVNGDGLGDVAATNGITSSGTVRVFSGPDGSLLDDFDKGSGHSGGVLALGRYDAGACQDFVIGAQLHNGNGGARIYSSAQGGIHGFIDLGHAKGGANSTPSLQMTGDLFPGGAVTVAARDAPANAVGAWFIGLVAGNHPFKQGVLVPSPFGLFFVLNLSADAAGQFIATIANPTGLPPGLSVFSQFWFADPTATAGAAASNGIEEIFP